MNRVFYIFIFVFLFLSCKQDLSGPDEELIGVWSDTNTQYKFNDNMTYELKYLRAGVQPNSVFNDSVFGDYVIDHKRKNLTFNLKGYVKKDGTVIDTSLNSTTWNYKFINDSTLEYESNTTLGRMKRVKI